MTKSNKCSKNDTRQQHCDTESNDDCNVFESFISRFYKNIKCFVNLVTSAITDVIVSPERRLIFAYFNINHTTRKVKFLPAASIISKWISIFSTYLQHIGFGSIYVGAIIAALLVPLTITTVSLLFALFWMITVPQILLIPITLGLSIITLIGSLILYALFVVIIAIILISMWIGLIAALLGIGFVYPDEICGVQSDQACDSSGDTECTTECITDPDTSHDTDCDNDPDTTEGCQTTRRRCKPSCCTTEYDTESSTTTEQPEPEPGPESSTTTSASPTTTRRPTTTEVSTTTSASPTTTIRPTTTENDEGSDEGSDEEPDN